MKVCENGNLIEIPEEEIENVEDAAQDSLQELIQGLSQATTVSQIRGVAKAILDTLEGENNG